VESQVALDPTGIDARSRLACPHLDLIGQETDGRPPRAVPDPANRCLALADPIRLSPDQQRLVCATDRHLACRRYILASTGAAPTAFAAVRPLLLRPAVVISLALVVVAFAVVVAYLLGGGTLDVSTIGAG
jgi:hypothetical protein